MRPIVVYCAPVGRPRVRYISFKSAFRVTLDWLSVAAASAVVVWCCLYHL